MRVPKTVRDRLGEEATFGLIELLDSNEKIWSDDVLTLATERFERRLTQEIAGLRTDMLREFHEGLAAVRKEMATMRVELLKWSFLFWIGQVATIAGLLAYMLRAGR